MQQLHAHQTCYEVHHPHQFANRQVNIYYSFLKSALADGRPEPGVYRAWSSHMHSRQHNCTQSTTPHDRMQLQICMDRVNMQQQINSCEHYTVPSTVTLFLFIYLYCNYVFIILSLYNVCTYPFWAWYTPDYILSTPTALRCALYVHLIWGDTLSCVSERQNSCCNLHDLSQPPQQKLPK